jgi:glyoxylase-like metal-dependent hydrolase (beta-lactamase superfamily II)
MDIELDNQILTDQGFGIYTIDTGFKRPGLVASHLIIEKGHAAFVDVGVAPTVSVLLDALKARSIPPENVDLIMVTHIHLDHAGAAGVLMRYFPNAKLVVHPLGARHMIDPSKLIAGAMAVYGESEMNRTFGEILPVSSDRVIEAADKSRLSLNGRDMLFLSTPGHARHHYCIVDETSKGIFTGDTFGLSYRDFDTASGPFIFPTTTPVQFDPDALHASIDRLIRFKPERLFLTHFGCIEYTDRLAGELHRHVDRFVEIACTLENGLADEGEQRCSALIKALTDWLIESLRKHGCDLSEDKILTLMQMDIELNAQGLEHWLAKKG